MIYIGRRRRRKIAVAVLVFMLALVGFTVAFVQWRGSRPPKLSASYPEITATQLYSAFANNEGRAQQSYGWRPVIVTAPVAGIDVSPTGDVVLKLHDDKRTRIVAEATIVSESWPATSQMSAGQTVRMSCAGATWRETIVILRECALA